MIKCFRNDLEFYLANEDFNEVFLDVEAICEKENIPVIINGLTEYDLLSFKKFLRSKKMSIEKNEEKYTIYDNSIKEELINLYSLCFNDSQEFINYFFADFSLKNAYYERKDGKIVSCFFLHYKTISYQNSFYEIPYIMGACTKTEYRKKGLFKAIFTRFLNENSSPFCLLSPEIFGFYEKFGFKTIAYCEANYDIKNYVPCTFKDVVDIYGSYTANIKIERNWNLYKRIWKMEECSFLRSKDNSSYIVKGKEIEEFFPPIYNKDRTTPYIMGRIINLFSFAEMFSLELKETKIIDVLINRNNINLGFFSKSFTIDELFEEIFKKNSHLFLDCY